MLIAAEITLLLLGLYALIAGKLTLKGEPKRVIQGWPVRTLGVIWLAPMPVSFLITKAVAKLFVSQGREVTRESFFWVGTAIEGTTIAVCFVAGIVLLRKYRSLGAK